MTIGIKWKSFLSKIFYFVQLYVPAFLTLNIKNRDLARSAKSVNFHNKFHPDLLIIKSLTSRSIASETYFVFEKKKIIKT